MPGAAGTDIRKVKAHRCASSIHPDDMEDWQSYVGNCLADLFAGIAANQAQLDLLTRSFVERIHTFAFLTLARLACCEWISKQAFQWRRSWELNKRTEAIAVDACSGNLAKAIAENGHSVVRVAGDRFRCTRCATTRTRRQFLYFTRVACGTIGKPDVAAKLGSIGRTTVEWHGHQLTPVRFSPSPVYACLVCKGSGDLGDFEVACATNACKADAADDLNGSYAEARRTNRAIVDDNRKNKKKTKFNEITAAGLFLAGLGHAQQIEVSQPPWLATLGTGHELWHARGLCYCSRCGCVASSPESDLVLRGSCRHTMPAGSRG